MSFRGRGNPGQRGRGRGGRPQEADPPERLEECGHFMNSAEGQMVFSFPSVGRVPRFNALVYKANKAKVGKIDEVMGNTEDVMFSVIPERGVQPTAFTKGDKIFCSPTQIMPTRFFTQPPPRARGGRGRGRGSNDARGRGGRGSGDYGQRGRGSGGYGQGGRGSGGYGSGGRGSGDYGRGRSASNFRGRRYLISIFFIQMLTSF